MRACSADITVDILLADDERVLRENMRRTLESAGYSVRAARNGEEALRKFAARRPDLVLLDVMMPRMNGFLVCEEIRKIDRFVPVLFLTALDTQANELQGLGLGADDYIVKTAGTAVILARIQRCLQRAQDQVMAQSGARLACLGGVTVDYDALTAKGAEVDARLSKGQADVLRLLLAERGKCVSTDTLLEKLKGSGYMGDGNALYVFMTRLKQKLGKAGCLIQSCRGAGYKALE